MGQTTNQKIYLTMIRFHWNSLFLTTSIFADPLDKCQTQNINQSLVLVIAIPAVDGKTLQFLSALDGVNVHLIMYVGPLSLT